MGGNDNRIDLESAIGKDIECALQIVILSVTVRLLHHDVPVKPFLDSVEPASISDDVAPGKIRTSPILFKH